MSTDDGADLAALVEKVFTPRPQPPHSLQLEIVNGHDQYAIFRTLGQLLTHGIVHLYGPEVGDLSHLDVPRLQQYMASVGWTCILNPSATRTYHPQALPWILRIPVGDHSDARNRTYVNVVFEPLPAT